MTSAGKALVQQAFQELKLDRVQARGLNLRSSRLNHCGCSYLSAFLAVYLTVAGCAIHHSPQPQPIVYPAIPETELQELRSLPQGLYDRLEIVTVVAEVGEQLSSAIKSARQSAAQKGANALVLLHKAEFLQRVHQRKLRIQRITYLAIHRR
ncbi:MAG: hypothetical protein JO313_14205 [Verrucomicrobia bacterium]|nr:hypothetical protein [Verrucomicrobiota bacterium]MBV9644296.1 hypothetical protein [Verrucomicrobiota bacterium]